MSRSPYDVLGVAPTASPEDILLAYRRGRMKAHPDRHPDDPTAAARFQDIQDAYETLTRPAPASPPPPRPDAFEEWLRRGRFHVGEAAFVRPSSVRVRWPWEAAWSGGTAQLQAHGRMWTVPLPEGLRDGDIVRVPGPPGDEAHTVEVEVQMAPPPGWHRQGNDVHGPLAVDVWTALVGGVLPWRIGPTTLQVQIPPRTASGATLRLRGQGVVHPRQRQRGDAYAHVDLVLPTELSAAQRTTLTRWRNAALKTPESRK